ncbi:hypothetical protein K2X85_18865 [bacterium]|jgi:hypothetical protein|nr:hypothetical protein [bacterium]
MAMRKFLGLGLIGLTGCANFCDTLFRARNVCRDQTAQTVSAPMVVSSPVYGCSSPVVCSSSFVSDVYSPVICDGGCAGGVVMSSPMPVPIATAISEPVMTSTPITTFAAGAAQPIQNVQPVTSDPPAAASGTSKPHPLLNPIRWMREHHQSKQ